MSATKSRRPFGKEYMDDVILCDAAPEMLTALERLLGVFKTCRVMACKEPMMASPLVTELQTAGGAIVAAEDAISKAKGT